MPGLRVAVDVTPLVGGRGGVAQCVRNLLLALPDVAPEVDVLPYVLSRRAREHVDDLPAGTRLLAVPAGVAIRAWGYVSVPSANKALADADVVHGTNFVAPPTTRPTTITVHDTWCLRHPRSCAPAVRPFDRAIRRAVRRCAWLHVSTESVATEVRARYATSRVEVVPFGVPAVADAAALPAAVREPYVLAVSTDEPRKRHAHLVRAFAVLASRAPDVSLVLAGGDAGATADVLDTISSLRPEVRDRVVRLGAVDDATRSTLLRRASVLAYPSADEGFGFPALEAMSVGVPVVATRVGAVQETAGDAALLVDVVDDVRPLVTALETALADEATRSSLVARGTARAASFTWAAHARGMADLWAKAAAES